MICDEQHIHKTLVAINFILALKSENFVQRVENQRDARKGEDL